MMRAVHRDGQSRRTLALTVSQFSAFREVTERLIVDLHASHFEATVLIFLYAVAFQSPDTCCKTCPVGTLCTCTRPGSSAGVRSSLRMSSAVVSFQSRHIVFRFFYRLTPRTHVARHPRQDTCCETCPAGPFLIGGSPCWRIGGNSHPCESRRFDPRDNSELCFSRGD